MVLLMKRFLHKDITFVQPLLVIAAIHCWDLFQTDVKNRFLNRNLIKEVYMQPLLGHDHMSNKVRCLRKMLDDLKKEPQTWYSKFNSTLEQLDITISSYNYALFIK